MPEKLCNSTCHPKINKSVGTIKADNNNFFTKILKDIEFTFINPHSNSTNFCKL